MSGPRSGYDLKKDFENRISHFWSESLGQIYPALHRMREEGLVRAAQKTAVGRPARTVYSITARGRQAFREWIARPPARNTVRNELLLKVYFGPEASPEQILAHIERHEADLRELQTLYKVFEKTIDRQAGSPEQRLYWRIALSSGRHVTRARLAWCRETREIIAAHRTAGRRQ